MAESAVGTCEAPQGTRDHLQAIASRLLDCLVAVGLAIVACGCTPQVDPAVTAQQDFEAQMAEVTSADEGTVESMLGSSAKTFEDMGIGSRDIYDGLIKHFSYAVDSAKTVSDDDVELTVTSTNVDLKQVFASFMNEATSYMGQKLQEGSIDEGSASSDLGKLFMDKLTAADAPTATATTTVDMKRNEDGKWEPTDAQQMTSVLFAGQDLSSL